MIRGPNALAVWKEAVTSTGDLLLELPDVGEPDVSYVVSKHVRVLADPRGEPRLSLTFVLANLPAAGSDDIVPLIRGATATMTVGPDPITDDPAERHRTPLFAQSASVSLVDGAGQPLATAGTAGTGMAASLAVTLDQDGALTFWSALNGDGGELTVACHIAYRAILAGVR